MIFRERERSSKFSAPCTAQHQTSTTSLSLNIIAILKWKLPLESVEKVVSKTECPKLFQAGLNYHSNRGRFGHIRTMPHTSVPFKTLFCRRTMLAEIAWKSRTTFDFSMFHINSSRGYGSSARAEMIFSIHF